MTSEKLPAYIFAAAALTALPAMVYASDNPGAHQHGHAGLQVAVSGNQIDLIFTSPAYNLLGFEHKARTEAQKIRVKDTIAWLGDTPLVNTPESGCSLNEADVHSDAGPDDDNGDHHDHGHDHGEQPGSHSDIDVTQTLTCSGLEDSDELATPLTTRFPELEELSVEWVWSEGQGSVRLAQGESNFTLTAK
ncbi:metal ABC transporter substrate-binding protein [Marinobacter salinus]|uniref:Metal ABC transporter substrate-binding protein n=1 Tax=Marinobacter salinus TaxID=1874317 RepID=A0A1D9GR15_9GAMM|nr:DUF2796 domain-containing protein [Marinobacter salinus]AOY89850.1 metal ABC transporter substrate-binding protein [Marinobacter salinus]